MTQPQLTRPHPDFRDRDWLASRSLSSAGPFGPDPSGCND
jgi:hypothetical protein